MQKSCDVHKGILLTATFPTPTLVTTKMLKGANNLEELFFKATFDICFDINKSLTLFSISDEDPTQGIEPSQKAVFFVDGVPPPMHLKIVEIKSLL